MGALLLFLILTLVLFGVGFTVKAMWYIAAIFLILWIVGFVARGPEARWYRW